jgi:hypothetical protein
MHSVTGFSVLTTPLRDNEELSDEQSSLNNGHRFTNNVDK